MMRRLFTLSCVLCSFLTLAQTWTSNKAKPDGQGCLSYEVDANQNRIPDFSFAGYKGGGVAIPWVDVVKTISPISGDNTAHVQDALDEIAELSLGQNGFRGALLLEAGTYEIHGSLYINASGIVLRGEGDGRDGEAETIIYGKGNTPHQRNLLIAGGGDHTNWEGQVSGTKQNITSSFVPVGSHSFDVEDATKYNVGDNIIINHPCTAAWLAAVDNGGTGNDPAWEVDRYPIIFNRYITGINGNTITIDAPVYNHLDKSLSQSFIYTYDREGLLTNIGIENLKIDIETTGGEDENHIWNAVQLTQVEDAWVQNCTALHFGLSGFRSETASRITIRNCHSLDPVAVTTGGRMYNFNCYTAVNNILFDNCYARNGRHHYVSNGVTMVSGMVVLRSVSENPRAASEGHRHWTTGMLFDNLKDFGSYPTANYVMAFYNRGDYGSGHGWSAAHSVFWNCEADRIGSNASIVVEQPPTAQNYAIGCKGSVHGDGPFNKTGGYIEGANQKGLEPASLYEAQLLCRKENVLADFTVDKTVSKSGKKVTFFNASLGEVTAYEWNFGDGAEPQTASGVGPHEVIYTTEGLKNIRLKASNGQGGHEEVKTAFITVNDAGPTAEDDAITVGVNQSVQTEILANDVWEEPTVNNALNFDGNNDRVLADAGGTMNLYPFTMMAWIKTSSTSEDVIMYIGNGNSGVSGNTIGIKNGKARLGGWKYDGSSTKLNIDGTSDVNDGKWHHVAGVFESPTARSLYVDGVLEGTDDGELDNFTNQTVNVFSVGNREDSSPANWWEGTIDEVKALNLALDQDEIQKIMQGNMSGIIGHRILDWNFNEGTGAVINDNGDNNFTGTVDGATWEVSDLTLHSPIINIVKGPNNGNAQLTGQVLNYTPNLDFEGRDTVVYQITDVSGLTDEAKVIYTVGTILGMEEGDFEGMALSPNPAKNTFQLTSDEQILSYRILDVQGKMVLQNSAHAPKVNCDISALPTGYYIVEIHTNSGKKMKKLQVIK